MKHGLNLFLELYTSMEWLRIPNAFDESSIFISNAKYVRSYIAHAVIVGDL